MTAFALIWLSSSLRSLTAPSVTAEAVTPRGWPRCPVRHMNRDGRTTPHLDCYRHTCTFRLTSLRARTGSIGPRSGGDHTGGSSGAEPSDRASRIADIAPTMPLARPPARPVDLRFRSRRREGAGNVSRQGKGWCRVDRCALFVDAGYALADGAMAVHGTRRRDSVSWDHAGLLKLLAGLARDRTGLPVLRCYWYETAEGGRTAEHDALAEMPGLKLRLVNTRPGRREGIESQLRSDIVTLAKSGAIADAFIASADEHLAEIVAEVQDLGLRVVILHIASDGGWTVPQPLRQECDDIVEISAVHLRPFVDLIRGAEPAGPDGQYAGSGYGSRSGADSAGPAVAASSSSGAPAQAVPVPAAYHASGGADNGPAQPYAGSASPEYEPAAGSRRSSVPEQALMAVR